MMMMMMMMIMREVRRYTVKGVYCDRVGVDRMGAKRVLMRHALRPSCPVLPFLHEPDEVRLRDLPILQRAPVHEREDPLGLVLGEEDLEFGGHGDHLVQREDALVVLVAVDGLKHSTQQTT